MIRNKRAPTAVQNGTFEISQASSPRYPPIYVAFFTISHRKKVLNYFVFLYLRSSVQSPDAKRTQIRLSYVSLIEVNNEKKST